MSDATEALNLIKQNNQMFEEFKSKVDAMEEGKISKEEFVSFKDSVETLQTKMAEKEADIDKLCKSIEAQKSLTKSLGEVDKDEQKRAQFIEFGKKFVDVCKTGNGDFSSLQLKSFKEFETKTAQFNSQQDSAGGLAVVNEIDKTFDSLVREYSNIRQWCAIRQTKGDVWKRPFLNKTNGAMREKDISSFLTATKTDTLSMISIPVHRLFSIIPLDADLIDDDMIGFVGELLRSGAEDMVITEGEEFVNGDGKSEFTGVKTYADGTTYKTIERFTTAGSNVISMDDLHDIEGKQKTAYRRNSAWYMPREIQTVVKKLKDNENNYLWQPSNILGQPATLKGYPVRELAELDTSIAVDNAEVAIFGDLRGYSIVDRAGTEVSRDPYSSYPSVLMRLKKRSGGGLTKGEMIKILKIKA